MATEYTYGTYDKYATGGTYGTDQTACAQNDSEKEITKNNPRNHYGSSYRNERMGDDNYNVPLYMATQIHP